MKIPIILSLLISTIGCFAQSGDYCGNKRRLKLSEIKREFPYNKTESIKLVSFKYEYPKITPDTGDIEVPVYQPKIPKTNGTVDLTKMFETKRLDRKQADRLLDILVNYDNEDREREVAFCYTPRNGIIFLDKTDKVIGFVEICFECLRYRVEPSTLVVTNFCSEKFEALKRIFKESGVKYGTVSDADE